MIDSILYSIHKIDTLIQNELKGDFDRADYNLEGAVYNEINFKRLLIFYDNELFEKASLGISLLIRWINAYYWYSIYLSELQTQKISIENHRQSRFKLIEQIEYYSSSDFDWSIIENIDKELKIK
jgi:hypothetical protein